MRERNVRKMSPDEFNNWWRETMIEQHEWKEGDQVEVDNQLYRLDSFTKDWYGWRESDSKYMKIPNWDKVRYTGYSERYVL